MFFANISTFVSSFMSNMALIRNQNSSPPCGACASTGAGSAPACISSSLINSRF